MPLMSRLASLWRNLVHRSRTDADLDDEVRAVHQLLVDEKIAAGMTPQQAARAATLELGGVESVKDQVRDQRSGAYVDAFFKDLHYAARMLRTNVGFTLVVVLSLGAAIGANTAIFSVVNAVMLRTLAVPDPDTLWAVRYESRLPISPRFSYPFFEQVRAGFPRPTDIAAMSRVTRVQARIGEATEAENPLIQLVSGEFFSTLRLQPRLGRLLTPDDNRVIGGHPVAVLSDAFWRKRFDASPEALGREFTLNGSRFTVVGVAPEGFAGAWIETPVDVWLPLTMQADVRYIGNYSASNADPEKPWLPQDGIRWLEFITRAERSDAAEQVAISSVFRTAVLREVEEITDPKARDLYLDRRLILAPYAHGSATLRDRFRAPLFALMGMVVLLLLIACANTANLLLARAASRQREMAVRLSIGASRFRVMGQLLTESLLLGVLAAAAGLAIAPIASELLVRMTIGVESGRPLPFALGIDGRVLGFTALITLLTSLLFGLAPAWRATDLSLGTALKTGGRGTTGGRSRLARVLVVSQVALSLLLVVGAGLFFRSFQNLERVRLGFTAERVLSATINPRNGGYAEADLTALYRRLVERAEALPGVQSATIAMCGVMAGCRSNSDGMVIEGYQTQPGESIGAQVNWVGERYFTTVGMEIVAGRAFEPADHARVGAVAIINESMAQRYFKGGDAVGKRFGLDTPDLEIVGVVRDARVNTVREAVGPMAYFPVDATPAFYNTLEVRTNAEPRALGDALRKALQELEPKLPVERVMAVTDLASNSLRQERLISRLTTLVSGLALGLACLGLYGLMSYGVKQRVSELGLRLALGASRPRVLWMIFRESLWLVAIGLAIGLPIVAVASRLIGSMLFEVGPFDPATVAVAMLTLLAVGATSGYLPARRASRVDPMVALRQD